MKGVSQVAAYFPFWGGTTTPYPKGARYLKSIEAKTPEQLAKSQLGGLKLLCLAILWYVVLISMQTIDQHFHLPVLPQAFARCAEGHPYPWYLALWVMIFHFMYKLLYYAMNGHMIISICRMSGFNAAKNTD